MVVNASGSLVLGILTGLSLYHGLGLAPARRRRGRALRRVHHLVDSQLGDGAPARTPAIAPRRSSTPRRPRRLPRRRRRRHRAAPALWPELSAVWSSSKASGGGQIAHEVAVPVRLVDAGHRGPVLVGRLPRREHGRLTVVGPLPRRHERGGGVGRAAQRAVLDVPATRRHLFDLGPDGDHGVAEAVELGQVLALGRLDHQRAGHREAHRRRVEAVVDEALGDVVDGDTGRLGQGSQVEDALVGHQPVLPGVEDREGRRQARRHVVGGQHGRLGGVRQALARQHPDVGPADGEDARAAEGRRADRADAVPLFRARVHGMRRQERHEVRRHRHRADARDRPRRGGCRTSCAGSGGTRRRRTDPARPARAAR